VRQPAGSGFRAPPPQSLPGSTEASSSCAVPRMMPRSFGSSLTRVSMNAFAGFRVIRDDVLAVGRAGVDGSGGTYAIAAIPVISSQLGLVPRKPTEPVTQGSSSGKTALPNSAFATPAPSRSAPRRPRRWRAKRPPRPYGDPFSCVQHRCGALQRTLVGECFWAVISDARMQSVVGAPDLHRVYPAGRWEEPTPSPSARPRQFEPSDRPNDGSVPAPSRSGA
jgi:hypothetical protein